VGAVVKRTDVTMRRAAVAALRLMFTLTSRRGAEEDLRRA
jgi:hypothetical protein